MALKCLELACVLLIQHNDVETFTRVYTAISPYYTGLSSNGMSSTARSSDGTRAKVIGLNLLRLLVLNDLSQFHSELERIPSSLKTHTNVKFALQLEQFLMEGNFSQFFDLVKNTPSKEYSVFVSPLVTSARKEILNCIAASYESLALDAVRKMLGLAKTQEVESMIKEHEIAVNISGGVVRFETQKNTKRTKEDLASLELAKQNLIYATELERIV
jgi:26S proteasome regulatory subunit N12